MAGRGSRLRPHSLTVPKPLIPVVGEPIVHRLMKEIVKVLKQQICRSTGNASLDIYC